MVVFIPKREDMRKFYYENMGKYILEHPAEFILVERGNDYDRETERIGLKVSFFDDEKRLDKEISMKYGVGAENNFFSAEIPREYIPGVQVPSNSSSSAVRENRSLLKKTGKSSRISQESGLLEVTDK